MAIFLFVFNKSVIIQLKRSFKKTIVMVNHLLWAVQRLLMTLRRRLNLQYQF